MVSVDGTGTDTNASKIRSVRHDRARELRAQPEADIAAPVARAEAADEADEAGAGWRKRMRETMRTEAARERHKRRKCTVEPVFGIIRNVLGFNRFHLGGIENVKAEGLLAALAHNCKRLCNLNAAKVTAA